jgi:3-oxoacyl-[acyl-carrier protein] reductase
MTMGTLDGQTALVSGAGRAQGMGRAIALRLAEAGADVAVADIGRPDPTLDVPGVGLGDNPAELEETAELVRKTGRKSIAVAIDISKPDSVTQGVAAAAAALGEISILVNNAGTAVGATAFEDISHSDWELSLRVNVLGGVNMVNAVLPGMKAAHRGSIINIASTLGLAALAEYGAYVVSKHAVVGLTRLLSQELAPHGIRTNAVAPGYIVTDMGKAEQAKLATAYSMSVDDAVAAIVGQIPVGRMGEPHDVAGAVAWLADPASSFINGAVVPVHGGQIPGFA